MICHFGHGSGQERRPSKSRIDRQDLTAEQDGRHGADHGRCGKRLTGVLGQAEPDLAGGAVHPAGGQIGRVEEIGLEARNAESAGEFETVVERVADRRVAAAAMIGLCPGDEELAAARGERGPPAPPHPANRQKARAG